jgi:hypothetical protein
MKNESQTNSQKTSMLSLKKLSQATASFDPFPHLIAKDLLPTELMNQINQDFPEIKNSGFLPISSLKFGGSFADLIAELESKELAQILSDKLKIDLTDKPHMITIRKLSAKKDGAIHTDSESKIATMLLYLNSDWSPNEDGGRFRVLRDNKNFDNAAAEVPPVYGNLVAFVRKDNSWHGHKPFAGERRVVQMTWLKSLDDVKRKEKRGLFSLMLKKILQKDYDY